MQMPPSLTHDSAKSSGKQKTDSKKLIVECDLKNLAYNYYYLLLISGYTPQ
jgi:hypothetical protein